MKIAKADRDYNLSKRIRQINIEIGDDLVVCFNTPLRLWDIRFKSQIMRVTLLQNYDLDYYSTLCRVK